jgi:hypothetical protein
MDVGRCVGVVRLGWGVRIEGCEGARASVVARGVMGRAWRVHVCCCWAAQLCYRRRAEELREQLRTPLLVAFLRNVAFL